MFKGIIDLLCPGLLQTDYIDKSIAVIRDGPVNMFVIKSDKGLICIDTGWRSNHIRKSFKQLGLSVIHVQAVLLTHTHWDHSRCLRLFKNAEIFVSSKENKKLLQKRISKDFNIHYLKEEMQFKIDNISVQVISTPGHTDGSISFLINNYWLFTGDTLKIKNESLIPFPFTAPKRKPDLEKSIIKLREIENAEYIVTSHSGKIKNDKSIYRG